MGRPASQFVAVLRWLAVVPAAYIALFFVTLVSGSLAALVLGWLPISKDTGGVLVDAISTAFALPAFVNAAVIVAPRFRAIVGGLLFLFQVRGYVTGAVFMGRHHWFTYLVLAIVTLRIAYDLWIVWLVERAGGFDENAA